MIMAFRDYDWWMACYERQKKYVAEIQEIVQQSIDCGEYGLAAIRAGMLRDALERLNRTANTVAEKMP